MAPQNDNAIIQLHKATKLFDKKPAVSAVSFDVSPGQIFGLIGPSGSGKTTIIHMMVGVSVPTYGEIKVFGVPPAKFSTRDRERIGYMAQEFFLYPTLTAWENLSHVAGLYGIGWLRKRKLIRQALDELELWGARGKLARDLSGGMARRLQLAAALLHSPDLAFVDEPMEGLDPLLRQKVWGILRGIKDQGKTIILTTHNMNEAEQCDTLALISEGRLRAVGKPQDLRRRAYGGDMVRLLVERIEPITYSILHKLPGVKQVNIVGGNDIRLIVEDAEALLPTAVEALRRQGIAIASAERYRPPFDDVFAGLVNSG